MADINKRKIKIWVYLLVLIACIGIFPLYSLIANIERNVCYPKVAQRLEITNSLNRIILKEAIYTKVKSLISTDMDHDTVISILNTLAPTNIIYERESITGGTYDFVEIDICFLPINNINLLLFFNEDRFFEEVRLIIDD
jgi:hypothetical protein